MARREAVFTAQADFPHAAPVRARAPLVPVPNVALLRFALPRPTPALVAVFDAAGQCVRVLLNGDLSRGEHACGWDGRNDHDQPVPAGSYVLRLQAAGQVVLSRRVAIH